MPCASYCVGHIPSTMPREAVMALLFDAGGHLLGPNELDDGRDLLVAQPIDRRHVAGVRVVRPRPTPHREQER